MGSRLLEKRISEVQRQIASAREQLRILEEQIQWWEEQTDDARIRSLVGENPFVTRDYEETARHLNVARVEKERRITEIELLQKKRDEYLRDWTPNA